MAGPAVAGKKRYVCRNGKTISVSKSAVKAHTGHGDRLGKCPPKPTCKAVVMMRCLNNIGELVVSGVSISGNVQIDPPIVPREACAHADMMNMKYNLQQVNTGLIDGETEYLFVDKSDLAVNPL
jgi:hypothetical protein